MRKQTGFTLIELIIVIMVLGILSAAVLPKFVSLQDDARQGAMNGLKAGLESASTLTYMTAKIENLGTYATETLSSGVKIRYGYPSATQTNLKLVLNINEEDWEMTGSGSYVIFTLKADTEDLSATEIEDGDNCKLIYNQAAKDERPEIEIVDCID